MQQLIFLGAGASKADGAPLQFDLLREYFLSKTGPSEGTMNSDLQRFFKDFYGIDTTSVTSNTTFPAFEDVLGTLELALARDESFRIEQKVWRKHDIEDCRSNAIALICSILADKLQPKNNGNVNWHKLLARCLSKDGNACVVSLNYDLLIDDALASRDFKVDYGTVFSNSNGPKGQSIGLYKLHGSLNWLRCPICGALTSTGAVYPNGKPQVCGTPNCHSTATPLIIPPTFFKVMSDFHLQQIWHVAAQKISAADRIYFCGYSLPDADIHIRYLLKRAEINRGTTPEVFIIANHRDKTNDKRDEECKRYKRLYRDPNKIIYTCLSFEDFVRLGFAVSERPRDEIEWRPGRECYGRSDGSGSGMEHR